jgi:ankyrin repeat protein
MSTVMSDRDDVLDAASEGVAGLSSSEAGVLFSRLSAVLGRPVEELQRELVRASDDEFQQWKDTLHSSQGTPLVSGSCLDESSGMDDDKDVGSGVNGIVKGLTGGLMKYTRPLLPNPVSIDDPGRATYIQQLVDALKFSLSYHDSSYVQDIVLQCPQVVIGLDTDTLPMLMHSTHSYDSLHILLKEGVDANIFDKFGSTLLHKYVSDRNFDVVKLLLTFKADCNIEDKRNQRTPLQLAALQGDFDALYALMTQSKVPVKVDKPDFDGNSLLHLVLQSEFPNVQYKSITMLLLDRGLSPIAKNLRGETPLHYFCVNQSLCGTSNIEPLFEMLLQEGLRGGSVDLLDKDRCTPLIIACAHREWELCKILIRHGADMNIPCSMSSALLIRGCDRSRSEVMDFESDCTTNDIMPRSIRHKIFPYICSTQSLIDPHSRDRCMNCAALFPTGSSFNIFSADPKPNCLNCGRVVCQDCIVQSDLPFDKLPQYLQDGCESHDDIRVCLICHPILSRDLVIEKYW